MPNKKPVEIKINLFPKDPFFKGVIGRSIQWALSVGRYIVIFTELLVILSFVARFTLDRQRTDINKEIEQKKSLILSYGELETNFLNLQKKLTDYKVLAVNDNIADIFPKLSKITPSNVVFENLTINQNSVSVEGEVFSQSMLNTFVNNLTLSEDFFEVRIDKIESLDDNRPGFAFSLKANTKKTIEVKKQDTETKKSVTTETEPDLN